MMSRRLILGLCAALVAGPVAAQTPIGPARTVAVTFDDLPYQASADVLCDPEQGMALTRDFLAMLEPLDSHATAFVNSGKICEAQAPTLLPQVLNAWLDAGIDLGNHTANHINIHATTPEAHLADVDAGAPAIQAVLEARGRTLHISAIPTSSPVKPKRNTTPSPRGCRSAATSSRRSPSTTSTGCSATSIARPSGWATKP